MGRPKGASRFVPSREQRLTVEFMAGAGIPEDDMSRVIIHQTTQEPIGVKTLRKYFRQELDGGHTKADAQVAQGLFKNATTATETYPGGIPVAQIFWLKTRARWRTADKDTPPAPTPAAPEQMDELEQIRRLSFMLAKGAVAAERAAEPPPKHAKKKITIPG